MIKWFIVFFVGCASVYEKSRPTSRILAQQTLKESRQTLTNKRNYLLALFTQSIDPYYHATRWSEECLAANKIGEIEETRKGLFFASQLVLNAELETGFCPTNPEAESYYVVTFHCHDQKQLREYRVKAREFSPSFKLERLCD